MNYPYILSLCHFQKCNTGYLLPGSRLPEGEVLARIESNRIPNRLTNLGKLSRGQPPDGGAFPGNRPPNV
jgi:hypothetical protein